MKNRRLKVLKLLYPGLQLFFKWVGEPKILLGEFFHGLQMCRREYLARPLFKNYMKLLALENVRSSPENWKKN